MYKPPKHTQAVREHHDGAIEIRAALLVHGEEGAKAIHVHILDVESVIKKISKTKGLEKFGAGCKALFSLVSTASDHFEDAHKIEITEHNVFGLLDEEAADVESQAEGKSDPKPQKAKKAGKGSNPQPRKKAAKKKARRIDPSLLTLPPTGGTSTPPDLPPAK